MEDWDKVIEIYKTQLKNLLSSKSHFFNSTKRKEIPDSIGIYVIFDKNSDLLYVGQSKNLARRLWDDHLHNDKIGSAFRRNLSECFRLNSEREITQYIVENCSFKYTVLDKPKFLEYFAISILTPKLNR